MNKVTPIDKSSTVLTILLAFILLGEPISLPQAAGVVGIGAGTLLMVSKKETQSEVKGGKWFIYALLSAVFASLTSIFGKIGVENVDSNLGTATVSYTHLDVYKRQLLSTKIIARASTERA